MAILTPYLNGLILTAILYPAGLSNSLYSLRHTPPKRVSTRFLGFLALPFLVVAPLALALRGGMFALHGAHLAAFAVAVVLAPLALRIEFAVQALLAYRTGALLRAAVNPFWSVRLSAWDHLLLALIALGEELFYRVMMFTLLQHLFGLPTVAALALSSIAYGLNHLAFGATTVAAKTITGMLYGSLFLLCGHSLWPPFMAHALQNILLLTLERRRNG